MESNPTVVAAARDYFGFQGDVMLADARDGMKELLKEDQRFDAVISDMGARPLEATDLHLAQKLLRPHGTFLFQWCYGGLRKHEMKLDKMMAPWSHRNSLLLFDVLALRLTFGKLRGLSEDFRRFSCRGLLHRCERGCGQGRCLCQALWKASNVRPMHLLRRREGG